MPKHSSRAPTRGQWQYVYDGRELAAVIELRTEGWRVIDRDGQVLGTFPTRQYALAFINARIASPPAAPITGEREADAERLHRIQLHQQQAIASRTRRSGTR